MLSLAAGAPPAFLTKPFITTDSLNNGGISVSSGDAFKHRAIDMSPTTQATSLGQATAGTPWTWQAKQYDGSTVAAKDVDCLVLLNINFKRFKVEYRLNGGAWTIFPGTDFTSSDFSSDHLILPLAPGGALTIDEWLVTATDTQGGDVEKAMGYFLPTIQLFQASKGTSDLNMKPMEQIVSITLFDGSPDQTTFLHNDADFDFMRTPLSFIGIPDTEEPSHRALRSDFFLFAPQLGKYPLQWYLCRVTPNSYNATPLSMDVNSRLMRVAYSLEEVGGN